MEIPRRPPVIVRAPEREKATDDKHLMDSSKTPAVSPNLYSYIGNKQQSKATQQEITVYTNSGVCKHCPALLQALSGCKYDHVDISKSKPPAWLPGTPTLVHKNNVYCGDAAFDFVENFDVPKSTPESNDNEAATDKNPFSKRLGDDSAGCGLSEAFAPPPVVDVDEARFAESTDDAMQRLLASRR